MKKFLYLIIIVFLSTMTACKNTEVNTQEINKDNIEDVCNTLKKANLSNVDIFKKWVNIYSETSFDDNDDVFSDADCRLTVMLLSQDDISFDSVKEDYTGSYLMFDIDNIDNNEKYALIKPNKQLFTTLFGEMSNQNNQIENILPDNWHKHGIKFNNDNCYIISLVFTTYEETEVFVGHTGILIEEDDRLLFVEKIAYSEPFVITEVSSEKDLIDMLSKRDDYKADSEIAPLVYKNDVLIGTLHN